MSKILVVDDEKPISDIIKFNLKKDGYDVVTAADGLEAIEVFFNEKPDLVLLDQMLPELDGTDVLRKIRSESDVPVIMVTAKDGEIDKVLGLEMGADDYVTKPFSNRELVARVKANLRIKRQNEANAVVDEPVVTKAQDDIDLGGVLIQPSAYVVIRNGVEIELTHREFELLYYLAQHVGQVLTREHLLQEVWGIDYYGDVRTVDVTIRRLREKIEEDPSRPVWLMTRRGVGYILRRRGTA